MADTWRDTSDLIVRQIDAGLPHLKQAAYNLLSFKSNEMPEPLVLHNELLFAVNLVERDIMTNIALLIREPWSRITTEKMLTLSAHEGERVIENLLGQQRRAVQKQEREYIDAGVLAEAQEAWRADKKARRVDNEFQDTVHLIRTTTAAHIYGTKGERLDTHLPWVYGRADLPQTTEEAMKSRLVVWAKEVVQATRRLQEYLARMRNASAWNAAVRERLETRTGDYLHALNPQRGD